MNFSSAPLAGSASCLINHIITILVKQRKRDPDLERKADFARMGYCQG